MCELLRRWAALHPRAVLHGLCGLARHTQPSRQIMIIIIMIIITMVTIVIYHILIIR